MKTRICCGLVAFVLLVLCGCSNYRKVDILGKTKQQITEEYGAFALTDERFVSKDSAYRGIGCGYTIRTSRVGFFGTEPELLFFIVFDESGKAISCYEGYHSNGG